MDDIVFNIEIDRFMDQHKNISNYKPFQLAFIKNVDDVVLKNVKVSS